MKKFRHNIAFLLLKIIQKLYPMEEALLDAIVAMKNRTLQEEPKETHKILAN